MFNPSEKTIDPKGWLSSHRICRHYPGIRKPLGGSVYRGKRPGNRVQRVNWQLVNLGLFCNGIKESVDASRLD